MAAETLTVHAVPVFCYNCQKFPVALAESHEKNSEFDKLLWSRWDKAMTSGSIFRYPLTDVSTRRIPGRYGFIVQRNIKRNTHRRSPAEMTAVQQPFDPEKFNFNKINKREVLLEITRQHEHDSQEELYLMIANVSPINYGHVLLVPSPEKCLPQVFTEQSLLTCLELVALSTHRGFCMVGNSTLAYASVNHLHYHFLYLEPPLMAVTLMGRHLVADCYELHEHPIPSVGFYISFSEGETVSSSRDSTASSSSSNTVSSALRHCAKQLYTAIAVLLDEEIPHNLCAIRGAPFTASSSPTKDCTGIRVLLVPRAPALGYKQVCETEHGIPLLNPAAMELSGFIQIVDQTRYDTVTESEIVEALRQKALTTETFERLKRKIIAALQEL